MILHFIICFWQCTQVDPELARTVIVSTKLDTKIPQFARASDVEVFLSPPACTLDGFILGDSPFFTSVPSGRVGSSPDSVYRSNDEFKKVYYACFVRISLYMPSFLWSMQLNELSSDIPVSILPLPSRILTWIYLIHCSSHLWSLCNLLLVAFILCSSLLV